MIQPLTDKRRKKLGLKNDIGVPQTFLMPIANLADLQIGDRRKLLFRDLFNMIPLNRIIKISGPSNPNGQEEKNDDQKPGICLDFISGTHYPYSGVTRPSAAIKFVLVRVLVLVIDSSITRTKALPNICVK